MWHPEEGWLTWDPKRKDYFREPLALPHLKPLLTDLEAFL